MIYKVRQSGQISQCQNDLMENGFSVINFSSFLSTELSKWIEDSDFQKIDQYFLKITTNDQSLYTLLQNFSDFSFIEHILNIRSSQNEWEEDGIWHDDGSRVLAFSLSLTSQPVIGGELGFRKKGSKSKKLIKTLPYAHLIIFHTGLRGYEHKVYQVTQGKRFVVAGWCE